MKQKQLVVTIPQITLDLSAGVVFAHQFLQDIKKLQTSVLYFIGEQQSRFTSFRERAQASSENKFQMPKLPRKTLLTIAKSLGVLLIVSGVAFGISKLLPSINSTQGAASQPDVKGATATLTLDKQFEFPLTDSKGKEISKIKYLIENAELRDEIIVKGQRATSVKGRTFLIVTLKITNDYEQTVNINSKNYMRLSVNGKDELLAPDIHNDPVEVQAISTKYTRVGFPINTSDTNLVLQIGEINGEKEKIELNFSK
jgi:hypothetical protein